MAMRIYNTIDAFNQLQPRHTCRRERKPGLRERHATQRERFSPEPYSKAGSSPRPHTPRSSTYCHTSGAIYNQSSEKQAVEPTIRVTAYKELSTIEDIRADMRATAKRQPAEQKTSIPNWLLNLDINLDVTSVDIIPPFEDKKSDVKETYTEQANVTVVYDSDDYEYDSDDDIELDKQDSERRTETLATEQAHGRQSNMSMAESETFTMGRSGTLSGRHSPSRSSHSGRRTPTGTYLSETNNPRRYQGDKKVMSMQQGGIRSTPMQPKSKKFINQMITYRHMKIHDNKLRKAKAAVDTRMPSTFQIALDRKRLVENRLSRSFDSTRESTQSRSSQNDSRRSKSPHPQR